MSDEVTRTVMLEGGVQALRLRRFGLTVQTASGSERLEFGQRTVTIGSSPDNDVSLDDPSVSRRHCRIEVEARGYRLEDLDSKNGTWIGDLRVRDVFLAPGSAFGVGGARIRFDTGQEEVEVRISSRNRFGKMFGQSVAMREIFGLLEKVAPTEATVLIQGKSGTGKELVAEAVHEKSPRKSGPLVVFDCSAVAKELIESELFGHVKGSFTGAVATRKGAFEQAHGGTLFLDELGELSTELQPKLLRALERREIRRVGGNDVIPVDVRIIAATNRNLRQEVAAGHFREDLYYRLAVVSVHLPPLAERPEDIPLLVEHFLSEAQKAGGSSPMNVSFETMEKLKRHPWPGNVRELKNFVERAVVLASGNDVTARFLQAGEPAPPAPALAPGPGQSAGGAATDWLSSCGVDLGAPFKDAKEQLVERFERAYWLGLLERTDGNVSKAARIAGVHRKSVEYILRKLDIHRLDAATPDAEEPAS